MVCGAIAKPVGFGIGRTPLGAQPPHRLRGNSVLLVSCKFLPIIWSGATRRICRKAAGNADPCALVTALRISQLVCEISSRYHSHCRGAWGLFYAMPKADSTKLRTRCHGVEGQCQTQRGWHCPSVRFCILLPHSKRMCPPRHERWAVPTPTRGITRTTPSSVHANKRQHHPP